MTSLVVIPARWGSTRLPGKPLQPIAGRTLLDRVVDRVRQAIAYLPDAAMIVATDDERVAAHARDLGCGITMTRADIATGTGRALAAARSRSEAPRFVISVQGDAPFFPLSAPAAIHAALCTGAAVVTPVVRLKWDVLDRLREHKKIAPFSGTTCVMGPEGEALWFSKTILPAMRDEKMLRLSDAFSPVHQHVGIYGFAMAALEQFEAMPKSHYERIEGLEQLRLLEAGIRVQTVTITAPDYPIGGIDTPADVVQAEAMLRWDTRASL